MIRFSKTGMPYLCIDESVWDRFLKYQSADEFTVENGGILIGLLNPANDEIIITDCTEPMNEDKRSRFHFFRSANMHQNVMDRLWKESDYTKTYLGEWHTHDENVPNPSYLDIKGWKRKNRKQHNSTHLFFVIIGRKEIGVWTMINETHCKLNRLISN